MTPESLSSVPSSGGSVATPQWLRKLLGIGAVGEGDTVAVGEAEFVMRNGMLRERTIASDSQAQTADVFGFKWNLRETFESQESLALIREWTLERYGDAVSATWWDEYPPDAIMLDAGCGAGVSTLEVFASVLPSIRYLGVDISSAVDVAAERFAERGLPAGFLQADITKLPLPPESVDLILSEGVLHHTDSPRGSLQSLTSILRPGGRFLFYVYRRKGPIREFTDDYIREQLRDMTPAEAWDALRPLSRFGEALGRLDIDVDIPEPIELLGVPAGRINLQRFVYWHVFKAYYHPDATPDEMLHVNYDWYAPANAHRQSPDEVRSWCAEAGLEIEHEDVSAAGITIVARKPAG